LKSNIDQEPNPNNPGMHFFLEIVLGMLAKLSQNKGKVSSNQIEFIKNKILKNELRLDEKDYKLAVNIFCKAIQNNKTLESYAIYFANTIGKDKEIKSEMIEWLYSLALADGTLNSPQSKMLLNVCRIFGFPETAHQLLCEFYTINRSNFFSILHCSPEDSNEKIKSSYRKLLFEFHPDQICSKGLPEILIKIAKQRLLEINEAYHKIKIIRGLN